MRELAFAFLLVLAPAALVHGADQTVAVEDSGQIRAAGSNDVPVVPGPSMKLGGTNGVRLKDDGGAAKVRNAADTDYADLAAKILNADSKIQVGGTDMVSSDGALKVADGVVTAAALGIARVIVLEDGADVEDAYTTAKGMSPTADDPVAIVLGPGVFVSKDGDNNDTQLELDTAHIHLIGSGRGVSIIRGAPGSVPLVKQSADNVIIANLTIENTNQQLDGPAFDQTSTVSTASLLYNCALKTTSSQNAEAALEHLYGRGELLDISSYHTAISWLKNGARLRRSFLTITGGSGSDLIKYFESGALAEFCVLDGGSTYGIDTLRGTVRYSYIKGGFDLYSTAKLHGVISDGPITVVESGAEIIGPVLADGQVTSAKIQDAALALDDVGSALAAQLTKQLSLSVGSEANDTVPVTIQVQDRKGANLADRFLVNLWLADAQYGAPTADGSVTMSVSTGTVKRTVTANKELEVITDSSGTVVLQLARSGSATFYLNAEVDGQIWVSSAISFSD